MWLRSTHEASWDRWNLSWVRADSQGIKFSQQHLYPFSGSTEVVRLNRKGFER